MVRLHFLTPNGCQVSRLVAKEDSVLLQQLLEYVYALPCWLTDT